MLQLNYCLISLLNRKMSIYVNDFMEEDEGDEQELKKDRQSFEDK